MNPRNVTSGNGTPRHACGKCGASFVDIGEAVACCLRALPVAGTNAFDVQEGGDHYKKLAIQPMQYNLANGIPFAEGNVIKYVTRWRDKGGVQDLKKARHVLNMLIEFEESGK